MKYPYAWAAAVDGHFGLSAFLPNNKQYQPRMEAALEIFRKHGDAFRTGRILYHLAYIPHLETGDLEAAKSTYQAGLDSYQTINDQWGMGECLHCIAHVEEQQGNVEKSHALFHQSLETLKPVGDRWSLYHPVGDTGRLLINQGELNAARLIFEESLQTFEELENRGWISASLRQLARICYYQGDFAQARQFAAKSLAIAESINDAAEQAWAQFRFGLTQWAEGEFQQAHLSLLSALTLIEKTGNKADAAYLKVIAGFMECNTGHLPQGREMMEREMERMQKERPSDVPDLLPWLAHALWMEKDSSRAKQTYLEAIAGVNKMRWFIRVPECLEGLGKIAVMGNNLERAARLFGAAETMREKMGSPIPPVQRGEYDASVQTLRGRMGTEFETIRSHGRDKTLEQATEYALEEANE
jgi:tetratricopeptide (TPR) repeat protein